MSVSAARASRDVHEDLLGQVSIWNKLKGKRLAAKISRQWNDQLADLPGVFQVNATIGEP